MNDSMGKKQSLEKDVEIEYGHQICGYEFISTAAVLQESFISSSLMFGMKS